MNLEKYPQFQLHLFTFQMLKLKDQLIPKNCDDRCVNASIINRAYYSAYLYCELWLEDTMGFKVKHPRDFNPGEKKIGGHKQVRNALNDFGEESIETELYDLFKLRVNADYHPFSPITSDEVDAAIRHMEEIFSHLQFK